MEQIHTDIDPYVADPGRWGASLVNLAEIMIPCLDAAGARSVVEVGAYAGDLTAVLVDWAAGASAQVWAIDPSPQDRLVRLDEERAALELVRETSLAALSHVPLADAVIIDGDHNYFTVSEELRLIEERAAGADLPLLMFHDVCWPHGRRDDYFAPELIPDEYRQPIAEGGGLHPEEPGIRPGALPYRAAAAREGGPRNGVLTAVEDFVGRREGLRLAVVPAFFGLAVVWHADAPWASAVAELVEPWDRNPLVARLEGNRVFHLAQSHLWYGRNVHQEAVLRRLLNSSAFSVAERLSRLRERVGIAPNAPLVSKDEIRRVLSD
ncbi:MAG: class I SAM-dependent methyltransferase [Solirubrobacteraceae bacterium]